MANSRISLSDEQQLFIDTALEGKNILVDACIGSGKTTAIQYLCDELSVNKKILYLTYNKLLKLDAKSKIKNKNVTVTNYHGFAYNTLIKQEIRAGISDLIQVFLKEKPKVEHYDVLIIDEYQDIEQELSELLEYVKSENPSIQIIAVGDMEQKIYDKTTLSVSEFISEFLEEYTELQFTQCFRLSKDLAAKLSRIWQKDINGINNDCIVEEMSLENVVKFLSEQKPKDVLCLGARVGQMADALNQLEEKYPENFNKKTVFASISDRNGTGATQPKKTSAIFTTFDSSKGLERDICVVFDFTESYWGARIGKPQQSYEILRNIFCVAASRGKKHIIFVKNEETMLSEKTLSENIDEKKNFSNVNISEMFDFKYKEDIEKCHSLLNISLISKSSDLSEITIENKDELIDLSPCIGVYQEAVFFENYDIEKPIELWFKLNGNKKFNVDTIANLSLDEKILLLTSFETRQNRYKNQVFTPFVSENEKDEIIQRLKTVFTGKEDEQVPCNINFSDEKGKIIFSAIGISDVVKNEVVYELKFVSELSHEHFLQCACYVVALGLEKGILWNTRENLKYEVKVPNKIQFLNSVAKTVTKGYLKKYYN